MPVWLFSCGPLDDPPFKEGTSTEAAERRPDFGHGVTRSSRDGLIQRPELGERVVVKAVKAPAGDFRDWEKIQDWTAGIAKELTSASAGSSS